VGQSWLRQPGGGWRAYEYVEGTVTLERAETPEQAYQAALAFGAFSALLCDLPDPPLHETIPGFHDTLGRVHALADAIRRDPQGRVAGAEAEIGALAGHWELARRMPALARSGGLRLRVVHNDTKLNNVLFDAASGRAACVIDLDTVMPGYLAYDFGDLVRSAANAAPEEGADPARAELRMPIFEALANGYLEGTRGMLDAADRESLAFAGPLLAFEVAVRFLTDHLCGDAYFRVAHPGQNLERCRVQLALLASMRARERDMARSLERA
jgi:aminoglycoside phosphotransferase (APT) family kinase protein